MLVNLPPGCRGFTTADGKRTPYRNGKAELTDDQFARLKTSQHAKIGMVSVDGAVSIGTKAGRWCAACRRLWQAWSHTCPKCGRDTVPEGE